MASMYVEEDSPSSLRDKFYAAMPEFETQERWFSLIALAAKDTVEDKLTFKQ